MAKNFGQIAQDVQRDLDDAGAQFYDLTKDIQPSLQDGYNLIVPLTESVDSYATLNFQNEKVFYDLSVLIPDYLRVFGIYNNNTNRWMWPTTILELYRIRDNWEICAGDPYWFLPVDYKTLAFFPVQPVGAGTFTIMYKSKAAVLGVNDIPQVPPEQSQTLEFYSDADLLTQCEEFAKAADYAQKMNQGIDNILKVIRNRQSPNHLYYIQGNM